MTHILRVGKNTGNYVFIGKDGREYAEDCTLAPLTQEDADVTMERIRQGYIHVKAGCYIVRLEHNLTQGPRYEITEVITFDYDDDGYAVPRQLGLLSAKANNARLRTSESEAIKSISYAYIDLERKNLVYLGNPLADNPTVTYIDDTPRTDHTHTTKNSIMSIAARDYMFMKPDHVALITLIYE